MCICWGRQDLDCCLVSKQAGGQRGSAALKDAMANWMTVSSQVCIHSLIPEGGWQQTWGLGYSLLHLGRALNSTYQTLKQDKSKHINCQAVTRLLSILRPIMKCFSVKSSSLTSLHREVRGHSQIQNSGADGGSVLLKNISAWRKTESGSSGWRTVFFVFFFSEWFLLRSPVEQLSDNRSSILQAKWSRVRGCSTLTTDNSCAHKMIKRK